MQRSAHLGVVDWGIGGLGVYKLARAQFGQFSFTYLSDTGVKPYGKMTRKELIVRLNGVIDFLRHRGITHILLACNAASTVIPFLNPAGVTLEGVIDAAIRLTERMRPEALAMIGGRRTVLSGVYRRGFAERGIVLRQRVAQPLSGFIERGDTSSARLRSQCKRILSPIRTCSHLLLGCTHYPAISHTLKALVSEDTVIIDPAEELVNVIGRWNVFHSGTPRILSSGDPWNMKLAARNAFGIRLQKVEAVEVRF
ncbi:MAG TPA: aspartate/glutamate racemase family protein [Blastocatellia bacterium]|nr:aspartate/glutamate racemase family protein [Blastocatellia bacterium]